MSDRQKGDSISTSKDNEQSAGKATDKKAGKQWASDVRRALRSAYDEAVHEDVPDDFTDLLGKLS